MKKALLLFAFISTIAPCLFSLSFGEGWGEAAFAQVPTAAGSYQWVKGFGGANQSNGTDEMVEAMKFDHEGNLIVCGRLMGYAHIQGLNGKKDSLLSNRWQNQNLFQGFVSKYDCNGNLLWFKELEDSVNNTDIFDCVIDSANNIYFLGKCQLGSENIYFGDSLLEAWSFNPSYLGPPIVVKLNKNGHMNWMWAQPSGLTDVFVMEPGHYPSHSGNVYPNVMELYKDTLNLLCYAGGSAAMTINGINILPGINIVRFTTTSGQMIDVARLDSNNEQTGGYGIDKDGNYLAVINFVYPTNKFLDSSYNRATASGFNYLSTVIKFNRHHVLRHIEAGDSTSFGGLVYNVLENGFTVLGGGRNGKYILPNFQLNSSSAVFGHLLGAGGPFSFDGNFNFKWGAVVDSTYEGGGFNAALVDGNGDVYSNTEVVGYMRYKNYIETTTGLNYKDFPLRLSAINGNPIARYGDIQCGIQNNSTNNVLLQNFLIDQQGNLYMSGNLTSNSVIVGTDTAQYYGGNNDMFIIKYGLPCGSNQSLIAAAAPQNVVANCNGTNIKITWQNISTTADKYYIYRSLSAVGGFAKIDSVSNTTTQYFDNNVSSGTAYWYALSAHNNVGEGYMSTSDSAMKNCSVGINSVTMNEERLTIYPNPCNDELRIRNYELLKVQKVVIENVIGQVVLHPLISSSSNLLINVVSLPSGIYFLKATDDKGLQHVAKFVKQ